MTCSNKICHKLLVFLKTSMNVEWPGENNIHLFYDTIRKCDAKRKKVFTAYYNLIQYSKLHNQQSIPKESIRSSQFSQIIQSDQFRKMPIGSDRIVVNSFESESGSDCIESRRNPIKSDQIRFEFRWILTERNPTPHRSPGLPCSYSIFTKLMSNISFQRNKLILNSNAVLIALTYFVLFYL